MGIYGINILRRKNKVKQFFQKEEVRDIIYVILFIGTGFFLGYEIILLLFGLQIFYIPLLLPLDSLSGYSPQIYFEIHIFIILSLITILVQLNNFARKPNKLKQKRRIPRFSKEKSTDKFRNFSNRGGYYYHKYKILVLTIFLAINLIIGIIFWFSVPSLSFLMIFIGSFLIILIFKGLT